MLRLRIISAIVIIAILAGACWLDLRHPLAGIGGLWLMPLGVLATVLASVEVCRLLFKHPSRLHVALVTLGNVLIFCSAALPVFVAGLKGDSGIGHLGGPMLCFALATCVAFGEQMRTYPSGGRSLSRLGRSVLALAYAGLLMSFLVALRMYGKDPLGFVALASMIVVVKSSDIGAYVVGRLIGGRLFGRARMAPQLSPKKTFEGGLGAILCGCLAGYLSLWWLGPLVVGTDFKPPPWWVSVGYGLALAVAGMFGDLAESLLKREAGAKDSSRWLPGLGGVLDLLDSILFAGPLAYAMWAMGILGG